MNMHFANGSHELDSRAWARVNDHTVTVCDMLSSMAMRWSLIDLIGGVLDTGTRSTRTHDLLHRKNMRVAMISGRPRGYVGPLIMRIVAQTKAISSCINIFPAARRTTLPTQGDTVLIASPHSTYFVNIVRSSAGGIDLSLLIV